MQRIIREWIHAMLPERYAEACGAGDAQFSEFGDRRRQGEL